jgi:CHAT domain-containing protein/tetratricopeptide (TPR) repeat protein
VRIAVFLIALATACAADDSASQIAALAKSADGSYAARKYADALKAYEAELPLADVSKKPFILRRIGLCQASLGHTDEALAVFREGVEVSEKAGDDAMLAENLHGEANILQRTGQYHEAMPFSRRELAIVEKAGQPEPILRALSTYAQEMDGVGRLRESLVLKERAVELSRRSTQPIDYSNALGNLASAYMILGDNETALRLLQSLPEKNAVELNLIAIGQKRLHRDAEAEASYRAALAAPIEPYQWAVRAAALMNLGILQHAHLKFDDARASLRQCLELGEAHNDLRMRTMALGELAEIAADSKDAAEAAGRAEEALVLARQSENPSVIVAALIARAHAFDVSGDNAESERTFSEALSITEGLRAEAPASSAGLQGEVDQWLPSYQYAVDHYIRAGNARAGNAMEALRLADRAKARVLLDMLDRGQPGLDQLADPHERDAERPVRAEVTKARQAALMKPGPGTKAALETALRKEEDFNLSLYSRHPELVLQRAAAPDIMPENLALLTPDSRTAVLSYFIVQNTVALFVARAGDKPGTSSVKAFTLPNADGLDGMIRSFRAQIAARDLDYRDSAKRLYNALIAPAAGALRGADRWILSPDGALWDVPFQALMDPQGKHLLETHALSYTPSLSVLRELREKPRAKGSLLAVAPIAESEREANAVAAAWGSARSLVLTGPRASAAAFGANAARASVIHVASHAETEANHPLESFLLFSGDGAVTARDLLGMRLQADLVVLSACETARGKIGQGDGVMGLGWAMLAAGARSSVLSQWKVDSAATGDLMIDFHRRLAAGKVDEAEALRQASLDVMRSPGRLHPFYWAAFIVLGDAR